ncbi:MAG: hypothetical protein ACOYMA_18335 [Bacteroidia bacterium]
MYEIKNYTKRKAKELGVEVKPSTNKNKKIDVFKDGNKLASIGAAGMGDYPTYLNEKGKKYADERRRLYNLRHKKDTGVNGKLAKKLLW